MEHMIKIFSKPDNIPIFGMLVFVFYFMWLGLRYALQNDRLIKAGEYELLKDQPDKKINVWPYLARLEFLALIITMIVLTVWSITIDAPLEEVANPAKTPNPSKAPWYFLGLQEMLVYFDPWIAGVVLPGLIIVGLMVIPYIDVNPKGCGYYTFSERKFAIITFSFGFIMLWVLLIVFGTFFRGPGWNFFWVWEKWDPHKVVALTNVNLSEKFGIQSYFWSSIFGACILFGYYALAVFYYRWRVKTSDILQKLGVLRYLLVLFFPCILHHDLREALFYINNKSHQIRSW